MGLDEIVSERETQLVNQDSKTGDGGLQTTLLPPNEVAFPRIHGNCSNEPRTNASGRCGPVGMIGKK
jgi:hypothetical protein